MIIEYKRKPCVVLRMWKTLANKIEAEIIHNNEKCFVYKNSFLNYKEFKFVSDINIEKYINNCTKIYPIL